jgi:hypothetical protein
MTDPSDDARPAKARQARDPAKTGQTENIGRKVR